MRKIYTMITAILISVMLMTGCGVTIEFTDTGREEQTEVMEGNDSSEYEEEAVDTLDEDEEDSLGTDQAEVTHYYFRNKKLLNDHYEKHGVEMGFASPGEYEEAACQVVHNKQALHKTEKEDGDDVYYVEETNEFVVVSTDGYLRTYFLPNAGMKYYERQ